MCEEKWVQFIFCTRWLSGLYFTRLFWYIYSQLITLFLVYTRGDGPGRRVSVVIAIFVIFDQYCCWWSKYSVQSGLNMFQSGAMLWNCRKIMFYYKDLRKSVNLDQLWSNRLHTYNTIKIIKSKSNIYFR